MEKMLLKMICIDCFMLAVDARDHNIMHILSLSLIVTLFHIECIDRVALIIENHASCLTDEVFL